MRKTIHSIIFILIICMLISCSTNKSASSSQLDNNKTTVEILAKNDIEVIEDLLPMELSERREDPITHIVLHFMSNAGNNPENPYDVQALRDNFKDYGVSVHYVIGRAGEIYQWVPEERVAYHAGAGNLEAFPEYEDKLNWYSIGIELLAIGTKEEMLTMIEPEYYEQIAASDLGYTTAQYETLEKLMDAIIESNPHIEKDRKHIIGHDEYAPERKVDPGSLFEWEKLGF